MDSPATPANARYEPLGILGQGSMGVVYRALDRLSGKVVALKQVIIATDTADDNELQELRLMLAHEFRTLAGLRHPHIISVLDYGFDAARQPFLALELLEHARPISEAGEQATLEAKVDLLVQALEALAYLHRRGVLHHDLKPSNILVAGDHVRLLDFGLAVLAHQERNTDTFGTLQYLAPEVIDGQPYTAAADLYGLGLIGYELLVGRYPFDTSSSRTFLDQLYNQPPDLAALRHPKLAQIIGQLLAKSPEQRPGSAQTVIAELQAALGRSVAGATPAIRESYLQAAAFVGREHEQGILAGALAAAQQGHGSVWLVGGESGVGKSRLLDELRIHALVDGFQVLRGQEVEGGGAPYQLWREPLRHLLLTADLADRELAVLRELVPDLESLVGRRVPKAPALPGEANQRRLMLTIVEVLRQQRQALVLLLEDVHWSAESLEILKALAANIASLPICAIASYRSDERPNLPHELAPSAQAILLERLQSESIAALSSSMLGPTGAAPQVVELLQRETEGNVFFLVEVVRALAEEAGDLAQISRMSLPQSVVAGGVQSIIQRRLRRVPQWAQPALRLAAVIGRAIDLAVMSAAQGAHDWDAWLAACADATIIELADGQWRFAHNKLRAAVLAALPDAEHALLHRQVAEALERLYPSADALADRLAEHWRGAGDAAKELGYLATAVAQRMRLGSDYQSARALAERGLALAAGLPAGARHQMDLLQWLGQIHEWQGNSAEAYQAYQASRQFAEQLGDTAGRAAAIRGSGRTTWREGNSAEALAQCEQAHALYASIHDRQGIAICLSDIGIISVDLSNLPKAQSYIEQALAIFRELNDYAGITTCLNDLGIVHTSLGNSAQGIAYYNESVRTAREVKISQTLLMSLVNLSLAAIDMGDLATGRAQIPEILGLATELGDRLGIGFCHQLLGMAALDAGEGEVAQAELEQSRQMLEAINARSTLVVTLCELSKLAIAQHDAGAADEYASQAVAIAQAMDHVPGVIASLTQRAFVSIARDVPGAAQADLHAALTLAQDYHMPAAIPALLVGFAQLAWRTGQAAPAAELASLAEQQPSFTPRERRLHLRPLLDALAHELPAGEYAAACARGRHMDVRAAIQALLAQQP